MTTAQPLPRTEREPLRPIDPDSPTGQSVSAALGELAGDVAERLRREGLPVPDCFT